MFTAHKLSPLESTFKRAAASSLLCSFLLGVTVSSPDFSVAEAQTNEIAVMTQLQGDVTVYRGKQTLKPRETMLLRAKDVVRTGRTGRAVIFQAYALVDRIDPNQQRTIEILSPPAPKNALEMEQFLWFKRHYVSAMRRRATPSPNTQGINGEQVLTLWEPRNGVAIEGHPTFRWGQVVGASSYTMTLYDNKESIIWTSNTTESRVTYPESRSELAPGSYKWEVTAYYEQKPPTDSDLYDATSFTVVSNDEAAQIRFELESLQTTSAASGVTTNLITSTALMEHKLYFQAQENLRQGLEVSPADQSLWSLLMETYFHMKLWTSRENARRASESPSPTVETVRKIHLRR